MRSSIQNSLARLSEGQGPGAGAGAARRSRCLDPFLALFLAGGTVFGCAEPAFSALARDNELADIQRALAASKPNPRGDGKVAYLVGADKSHLWAYDLVAARPLWDVAAEVGSRLAVARCSAGNRLLPGLGHMI